MIFTKCQRFLLAAVLLVMVMPVMMLLAPAFPGRTAGMGESRITYERNTPEPEEAKTAENFREEQTYTAVLPHETEYCYSDVLPEGMRKVMTKGRDGELLCTALVTYVDGVETSRQRLTQRVTVNPITEVIAVGTGLVAEGKSNGNVVITEDTIVLPTGEKLTYTDTMQVRATGYTHTDAGCDRITSTGTTVRIGTVAVDPRYIPYGTRMFIVSNDGSYIYGISVAEDCGGAIKKDRVDLYFPTTRECFQFGRRDCTVYFLG